MLCALLALTALHGQPPRVGANMPIESLVAMAWQESDDKTQEEKNHQRDLDADREVGKKYAAEADKELKASQDKEATARVQRIGAELAEIANKTPITALWGDKRFSKFDYTFKLVEGKDVNAFSLPGGYIYIYEGLVKYAESDDELAGVIAHEITHASLRHVATLQREQQKLQNIQLPLILIAILTGKAGEAIQGASLIGQAVGSGWSVKAEQAADYGGFQYMVHSKYNPTGMLTMMERLAMDERNQPYVDWGIYRTHPPSRERASAMMANMRNAGIPVRRSVVTTTFRTAMTPGNDGTVKVSFGKRLLVELAGTDAIKRADDAVDRLNVFFDSTPEMFEVGAGDDGTIVGRAQQLIKLTQEDAAANKKDLPTLKAQTIRNIQASLFSIGFKAWDDR